MPNTSKLESLVLRARSVLRDSTLMWEHYVNIMVRIFALSSPIDTPILFRAAKGKKNKPRFKVCLTSIFWMCT